MNFKVGYSYLNTALRKSKSIPYLEKTVEVISETKSNTSFTFEAKFYLGKAYHNNYEFEKAIEVFSALKETTKNNELIKTIDKEIDQCKTGIELMKKPVKMQINNLGDKINSPFSDHSPVISANESVIIFTSRRKHFQGEELNEDGQYNEDIYISYNKDNSWQEPKSISPYINTNGHEASIALTPDGQQLFIYKSSNGGTILTSYLNGDEWSEPKDLGANINTHYRETDASPTADGKYLYFTSDRPGGYGGIDIYVSEKQEDGTWGKAKNLGPTINTSADEEGPFIYPDGKTLLFSSKGHETMGGFDIFRSKINEFGTWNEPENVGYPINTVDNDVFLTMTPDGKRAYFSSFRKDGYGKSDIYMMAFPEAEEKPVTIVKGNVEACKSDINEASITVSDKESGNSTGLYKPISLIKETPCDKDVVIAQTEDETSKGNDLFSVWEEAGYTVVENIFFKVNSSQCSNFNNNLKKLAKYLIENPGTKIEIVGYSDTQGPETYNLKLSKKRAINVYYKLLSFGVDKNQMDYKGDGTKNQISINNYDNGTYIWESLPYNRRVEVNVISDAKNKLKIAPIEIPILFDKKAKAKDINKEINRLDSIYTIQLGAYSQPVQQKVFGQIKNVQMYYVGRLYKYSSGEYKSEEAAKDEFKRILGLGYTDAFIRKVSEYFPKM